MEDQRLAVHRTIVVVDVEGFGDQRRTNPHQVAVRDGLYRAMREAFGQARIPWADCDYEDRGDGMFVLVPAEVPKGLLVDSLPSALVAALRAHNAVHPGPEWIRLRMALHAGEVCYDEHGVTAAAVNLAFRLLDANALKAALAGSPGVLGIIASSWFFDEVVRHSGVAAGYRPVDVAVKETRTTGWVCLPDHINRAGQGMLARLPAADAVTGTQPAVVLRTLPRDTAAFTGRTDELIQLMAAVSRTASGGVIGIHAVDGMAGIGKTTFAVHAAHQLAACFPDGLIFLCLHAHTAGQRPVDPAEALATLLLTTGVEPAHIPPGLEARSAAWRSHLAGQKVLLVLDDAAGSAQVRPLLPAAPGCLVLITSRRRLTGLEDATPISLDTLPPRQAADLFVGLAARPGLQPSDAAVVQVAGLCGYLPLAIRLVAAGLRHHPAWTVTGLAAELAAARDRVSAIQAEDVSIAAAFDMSYRDLTADQQRLFRRLGLHPGADIDAYAAAALDDTSLHATRRGLAELYDHNLIGEPARGRYRLHDLLREYARACAAGDGSDGNQAAIDRLLDYYLHTAATAAQHVAWRPSIVGPPSGPAPACAPELRTGGEAIAWLATERANLHACVDYAAARSRPVHAVGIPAAMSGFLYIQGHWNEAVALGQAALATACRACDRHGQGWTLEGLGVVQWRTGDYAAATANLTRALDLFGDLGEWEGQAWALEGLGVVQWRTGDYPAATASLTRALDLFGDLGEWEGQAWALEGLGDVQQRIGDYPAATASLTRALELFNNRGHRYGQAWTLESLGVVQRLTGDYPGATASLTRALELFGDLGDRHGQAWIFEGLGAVHRLSGDYPAATVRLTRALELFGDLGHRRGQAWALHELGVVQRLTGDYPAAAACLAQALELFRELCDRHGQAGALINLGELLLLSSAYREARDCFTQALGIARDIDTPVEEAKALEAIRRSHVQEGNPGQGAGNIQQALAIYRRIGVPEAQHARDSFPC